MKKIKPYIINTSIVILILLLVLIASKTSPFGNNSLGINDALVQHKPFLYNFIMSIKNNTLTNYSFNNGLGNPTIFNIILYLASPLNLIALLFNKPDTMLLSVITLKLALTAITTTYYTKKKNTNDIVSLICTISYTFSGWFIAYYYNNMWLDTFMIFPLFQYGLESLIKEHKCLTFILSFCYIFITNFLLIIPITIYTIIYFIIYNFFYLKEETKNKLTTTKYFISSLIISTLILSLPISILINTQKQTNIELFNTQNYNYTINVSNITESLIYGNKNIIKDNNTSFPNLGMNTIILLSLIYFFTNKKINTRDKLFVFIAIDIILFSTFFIKIDYIINMFYDLQGITYRYAFILNFLAIMLFIYNANNYKYNKKNSIVSAIILSLIFLITFKQLSKEIIIINLITIITYLIIALLYKNKQIYNIIITIVVILQTTLISYYTIPSNTPLENNNLTFEKDTIKYRQNKTYKDNEFLNQNQYTNQKITYQFSYMNYRNIALLLNELGCEADTHIMRCDNENKLFNMYFNVKNNNYLEKIYTVNKEILTVELNEDNVKLSEEYLVETTTGIKDIFEEEILTPTEKNNNYYYHTDKRFYLMDDGIYNYVNTYNDFYIGKSSANTKDIKIYTLNQDKLNEIYNYLKQNQIQYTTYKDNYIEGNIKVPKDQIIFTSIPYDESWQIKVDDKIVKPSRILNSLIAIKVDEGEHKLTLQYKNSTHIVPTILSISSLLTLIIYSIIKKRKANH